MDKKSCENVVADHMSKLIVESQEGLFPLNDSFPDEQLLKVSQLPWFVDIVNYIVLGQIPTNWSKQDKLKFLSQVKYFFWDDPYLFKVFPNQIIRRCVPEEKFSSILLFCHTQACGGYFGSKKTTAKCCNVNFTGLPYLEMCMNFVLHVIDANG